MATINATLNLNSSDLVSSPLSLSKTMTMKKADTCIGLDLTTGLSRKKFTAADQVDLLTAADLSHENGLGLSATAAAKIYIKNTGSSSTAYFTIGMGASSSGTSATANDSSGVNFEIGRLYGGDWMLIPWLPTSGSDICILPSTAEEMTVEYMLFGE